MSGLNDAYPPPRLSGPAAEVDAGPEGPVVGAFFDLDGSLVAGYTAAAQTRDRLRRRDLRMVEFLTIVDLAVQFRLGRRAFETLIESSALTVKGRLAREVDEMGERIFRQSVADLIYPEMRELVRAHQRRGHSVVLSSSALTNQAAPVAHYLGIEHIVCNRLVADEQGILTGEIEQRVVWGPTKASGVQQFAADHQVDLGSSYFYADADEDLSLMCLVGRPRPVNPAPRLAKVAVRRGWPVMRFSSRGSGGPRGMARRLASASCLGPLAAAALGVGLVRRNKRAGVNFLTRFWPGTAAALRPLAAAARKGLSTLIAPEGTRVDTESVGPFKKRAFLIAMAAGLPIVPIVIRNSESVAGRNSTKLNPGTVDIAVLPPVSVEGWTLLNLRERIEQIRSAYLETLAEWPVSEPDASAGIP